MNYNTLVCTDYERNYLKRYIKYLFERQKNRIKFYFSRCAAPLIVHCTIIVMGNVYGKNIFLD